MRGGRNYTKVGDVERKVNWPIKIRSRFGPMDANDYYSRKLRSEIDDHNFLLVFIERDIQTNSLIAKEMKAFISAVFGNDGWIKLVEARWLRNKQSKHLADYDPGVREQVPVYVKSNFYASTKFQVPRQIIDELPTHGTDQFGGLHSREAQPASMLLHERLHFLKRVGKDGLVIG